jgi:hypothetical protein
MLKAVLTIVHGSDSFPGSEQYYLKFTSDQRRGTQEHGLAKTLSYGKNDFILSNCSDQQARDWVNDVYNFAMQIAAQGAAPKVDNVEVKFMRPKGSLHLSKKSA